MEEKLKMYRLTRTDGLIKESSKVKWIEFGEDDKFKGEFNSPSVGRSLVMSPFNQSYTWMTTLVTEVLEASDDLVRFKTENSIYKLERILVKKECCGDWDEYGICKCKNNG